MAAGVFVPSVGVPYAYTIHAAPRGFSEALSKSLFYSDLARVPKRGRGKLPGLWFYPAPGGYWGYTGIGCITVLDVQKTDKTKIILLLLCYKSSFFI